MSKKIATLCFLLPLVWSCANAPRVRVALDPPDAGTLVVCVGGVGHNQLDELVSVLAVRCPAATIVNAGDWNSYNTNVDAIIRAYPRKRVVVVLHSLAAVCAGTVRAHWLVMIDPPGDPPTPLAEEWELYRLTPFFDHNTLAHDPRLIDLIVDAVNGRPRRRTHDAAGEVAGVQPPRRLLR